ncbi:MAG: serine/threonine protein kinase [Phycisphaeraceae bacterium]|nr:serine/threonine protein kinase [Phycisphaeraceae bacterium]
MAEGKTALDYPSAQRLLSALGESLADAGLPRVPGFTLRTMLGEGAAGQVFLATREGSERRLALKIYRAGGSAADRQRALRELEAYSRLRLECLPRVIESGELDGGQLYLAMEYVEARRLDEVCGGMPRREVVGLLARVADAVQSMHEIGVIHRDLKPSNILIDVDGRPVIVDLGLAAPLESSEDWTLTREGAPIGTPAFMSPEQARADRARIGTRSDVYALGATACQVLTGHTPHEGGGSLTDALRRAAEAEARDPRALDPTLPRPLAAVLLKAVSREPARRYASCAELGAELRRWLEGEPVQASPPGAWRRMGRWIGRHPVWTTAGVCVLVGALILGSAIAGAVVIQAIDRRPARVAIDPTDSTRLEVFSRWGRNLGTINIGARIGPIEVVEDHPLAPSELIAFVGAEPSDDDRNECVAVIAISPDKPLDPRWKLQPRYPSWAQVEHPAERREDTFAASQIRCFDVFPESPGEELVTIVRHRPYSQTLVSVTRIDSGEPLFSFWHDGYLGGVRWCREAGLLLAVGVNSDGEWASRGETPTGLYSAHPTVCFAVRPRLGLIEGVIRPGSAGHTLDPEWYRCLLPAKNASHWSGADGGIDPSESALDGVIAQVTVQARVNGKAENLKWSVTADGRFARWDTSNSLQLDAALIRAGGPEASLKRLHWGELPPRLR